MSLNDVLALLSAAASVATIGTAVADAYAWLMARASTGIDGQLQNALNRLPPNASADDIVRVIAPFMSSVGGSVALSAGDDGGGNVHADGVSIEGGTGRSKGGDVTVKGGDGGPHGRGGDFTITGGTIKGGDAK